MNTQNVLFCGVGGQGVLKASEVCGLAAMKSGYRVRKSEVHGMSQRGGSVESHLRFGDAVYSPLIAEGDADYLVCFDADEGERLSHFLKKDGVHFGVYLDGAAADIPNPRFMNTYMLGVLSAKLPVEADIWMGALEESIPRALDENKEVFLKGRAAGEAR
jgi:indolepyruvate ferredoxin oxidoreductase beta subunit